jgi:hypothetical protein
MEILSGVQIVADGVVEIVVLAVAAVLIVALESRRRVEVRIRRDTPPAQPPHQEHDAVGGDEPVPDTREADGS